MHRFIIRFTILIGVGVLALVFYPNQVKPHRNAFAHAAIQAPSAPSQIYLPLILGQSQTLPASSARRVNAPHFASVIFSQTAIFWFGRITQTENYADVRVGYTNSELYVNVTAFDKRLWYDTTPSASDFESWDAVTLYLNTTGNSGSTPSTSAYRFKAQLNWWESRTNYQASYRGNGSGWTTTAIPFTTSTGWRGNAPNDNSDDRGWVVTFQIPFSSLGVASPPASQSIWGMALALHDRDDATGTPITDKVWPENSTSLVPSTWGQVVFGLPTYTPPTTPVGTVTIRQGLNGTAVSDAAVGGGATCGDGLDYWTQWGQANYAGNPDFNIQNQSDVADWPCFSKYYVTFPLNAIPAGKKVVSATLTLYQFGNAGSSGQAQPSLIQVLTINDAWSESTLNWNNAPLGWENVSRAWVDPLSTFPGWPGAPRTWDVSGAVAQAYSAGQPLRLVLYSADDNYHSGKYFVSSDTEDWNAVGRPTLVVQWGN